MAVKVALLVPAISAALTVEVRHRLVGRARCKRVSGEYMGYQGTGHTFCIARTTPQEKTSAKRRIIFDSGLREILKGAQSTRERAFFTGEHELVRQTGISAIARDKMPAEETDLVLIAGPSRSVSPLSVHEVTLPSEAAHEHEDDVEEAIVHE